MDDNTIAIIGTNIALMAVVGGFIVWAVNKLDGDIKAVGNRVDALSGRIDSLNTRLDGHASRIDQLYQMFIQLIKDKK
jgi:hypothetical protein